MFDDHLKSARKVLPCDNSAKKIYSGIFPNWSTNDSTPIPLTHWHNTNFLTFLRLFHSNETFWYLLIGTKTLTDKIAFRPADFCCCYPHDPHPKGSISFVYFVANRIYIEWVEGKMSDDLPVRSPFLKFTHVVKGLVVGPVVWFRGKFYVNKLYDGRFVSMYGHSK